MLICQLRILSIVVVGNGVVNLLGGGSGSVKCQDGDFFLRSVLAVRAVEVELVHAACHLGQVQAVEHVVIYVQEVAVPVRLVVAIDDEVALVVVELQDQEVVPTRDGHAVHVTPGDEGGMLGVVGGTHDDVVDGVAVLKLLNIVNEGGQTSLTIGVGVTLDNEFLPLAVLVIVIDSVGLRHVVARHLVQRRYPGQGHLVVAVTRLVVIGHGVGLGMQGDSVDTHLGGILGIVLCIVG